MTDYRLYLVTARYDTTDAVFLDNIAQACAGGVTLVQLREKETLSRRYLELATAVKRVTDRYNVPLIIDDRIDICLAVDAAGVHVGDSDLPVPVARELLGPDKIIGASVKTVPAARAAVAAGADYLGVGALYPTTTKVVTRQTSVATLSAIVAAVPVPVVAIGGIKEHHCRDLMPTGIAGICMVSEIMAAKNVRAKVTAIRQLLD